ncbi:MAG TPA: hotdog fold thioesterase, partial [Saprospiraceae bacterium]|nr:hotdog fold thioesterase [Saprospiraceae bacterium]
MIWKAKPDIEMLQKLSADTMVEHIGIEFTEAGDDYLIAKMPVDHRTVQPMRLLHGGANVTLAETLGSVASTLCLENFGKQA